MTDFPTQPHKRIIKAPEADSWIDGYAFLKRARKTAAEIRAKAREEVKKATDLGREEGRREGEAEAAALLHRTHAEIDRYYASIEPQIAELSLRIVQEIIGSFTDADLVARIVRHALTDLRAEEKIVIAVAPEIVSDVQQALEHKSSAYPVINVVGDRHLTGRQCLITTGGTSIDISVDAQIAAMREVMTAARSAA